MTSRLLIVEPHPVQYHAPVYRAASRLCEESGMGAIRVLYGNDRSLRGGYDEGFGRRVAWDEPLLEGYSSRVVESEGGAGGDGGRGAAWGAVVGEIRSFKPGAILLTSLATRLDWAAYVAGLLLRVPVWIRVETQDEAFERTWLKSLLRGWFYRVVYFPMAKALTIGRLNDAHMARHGFGADRRVPSRYCVVDRFAGMGAEERVAARRRVRELAGFEEGRKVILFCGKLQPKKNPGLLVEAMEAMSPAERAGFGLLFVGSGEMEGELRERLGRLGDVKVHFAGFVNQRELPPYYLGSDLFVLPSRRMGETWGLVVNEALHAGLPVIVSRQAGCHADFGESPGVSVFDGGVGEFLRVLRGCVMGGAYPGREKFMRSYSVAAAAMGILEAMGLAEGLPVVRETPAGVGVSGSPGLGRGGEAEGGRND